jgi:anti-sigma B factor antagonist
MSAATDLRRTAEDARTPAGKHAEVLVFEGDLDLASVAEFEAAVAESSPSHVVLDLRGVRFIDSSGIHAVVRARLARADGDGALEIVVASGSAVERVLDISGLADELRPHRDPDGALAALDDGPAA